MEARLVHPKDVPPIWQEVKPLIDKALVKSDPSYNALDYLTLILNKTCTLWIGLDNNEIKSALVCEILTLPRTKALAIHVWATKSGYDYEPWMKLFDNIEEFGRLNGCTLIEVTVRKGLAKKLNWNNKYSVLTKQL
tara:strand:+ start:268 stop:675 length:408 start_codon:yes stop_codon:yes gene_type:complete